MLLGFIAEIQCIASQKSIDIGSKASDHKYDWEFMTKLEISIKEAFSIHFCLSYGSKDQKIWFQHLFVLKGKCSEIYFTSNQVIQVKVNVIWGLYPIITSFKFLQNAYSGLTYIYLS